MTALGVGIVGARFAADLHAVNYRHLRGGRVELVAVCARTRAVPATHGRVTTCSCSPSTRFTVSAGTRRNRSALHASDRVPARRPWSVTGRSWRA